MEMTANEKEYQEVLLSHGRYKIYKYLVDTGVPLKDRLVVYLATPKIYFTTDPQIPQLPEFEAKYGPIDWKQDFPFLLKDQAVNLVKFAKYAVQGNYTYFPQTWSQRMIFDFIIECVNLGLHEFEYY